MWKSEAHFLCFFLAIMFLRGYQYLRRHIRQGFIGLMGFCSPIDSSPRLFKDGANAQDVSFTLPSPEYSVSRTSTLAKTFSRDT